ncbi:MAG TPA: HAMP domain-containing protein, partial [Candidatus Baltobacteraceae bacterium]|nr:HAMP domain-containing protein [Candidatus Baltobacteraceae bacterium]
MSIFKSIKWRPQIWYGLILVLVLAGLGFTAYQLEYGRLLGRIDNELHRRIGVLANALHRPPPGGPSRGEHPFDRPPPDQALDDEPLGQNPHPLFHLPPEAAGLFDTNDPNGFYFIINRGDKEIAHSDNYPNFTITKIRTSQNLANAIPEPSANGAKPPPAQTFDDYREAADVLPSGEIIRVGCSIAPELKELRLTALKLAGFGCIILFFGLAGGWWFVSLALQPVEKISAAAVKISAGDLSQRINIAEAESELGKLAAVLNSTFARLESAFAQQKQFASDAAHELRTPVSVILTQAQTA